MDSIHVRPGNRKRYVGVIWVLGVLLREGWNEGMLEGKNVEVLW